MDRQVGNGDDAEGRLHAYDAAAYGDSLATEYDALYPQAGLDTDAAVAFLADLAERHPGRSILEFGIGTGRLAIQLYRRGLVVAGIDASAQMVAELRRKAPDAEIDVVIGDFVSARVPGTFSVVAAVYNSVLDERGLPAQMALFENAARHLVVGGYFVVEAFVMGEDARDGNWIVSPRYVGEEHVELQMARFDIDTNTFERTLVHLRSDGLQFITVRDAYAGPAELDIMAFVNGMSRVERYSSWSRAPFISRSRRHITVYKRGQ